MKAAETGPELNPLVNERKTLKEQLAKDGFSSGLKGMDDIKLSSMDIVGVSLFYPSK